MDCMGASRSGTMGVRMSANTTSMITARMCTARMITAMARPTTSTTDRVSPSAANPGPTTP